MKRFDFLTEEEFIKLSICDVIAVTGPMAAGKNYICNQLDCHGFVSIDADEVVHEAINIAQPEILKTFGQEAKKLGINLLNKDGTLNRKGLGSILFENKDLLAKQEAIVYPIITKTIDEFIINNPKKKIILNATVLYKTPALMDKCQLILYVTAPFITRLIRARKRDKLSFKQILARFRNQKDLLKKYKKTNKEIIIINNKNS